MGILLVMFYTVISAAGGVYNEWLYKVVGRSTSMHLPNLQMYSYGIAFNALGIVFTGGTFSIGQGHAPLRLRSDGKMVAHSDQESSSRESFCPCTELSRRSIRDGWSCTAFNSSSGRKNDLQSEAK